MNIIVRVFAFVILLFIKSTIVYGSEPLKSKKFYDRNSGLVPNKETALKIAEIVLVNIYGEEVKKEKPFIVSLKNDKIWIITGSWNSKNKNSFGGVAYMEIQKSDCRILKVIHGK